MKTLSADIGIIGGADGPTSVIVSTSDDIWIYVGIAVMAAIIIGAFIIKKRKNK